jgi:hypothetical protein
LLKNKKYDSVKLMIQYIFPNQLGKILLFVTSYEKCDVSQPQLILKSVTLYVKIRKNSLFHKNTKFLLYFILYSISNGYPDLDFLLASHTECLIIKAFRLQSVAGSIL